MEKLNLKINCFTEVFYFMRINNEIIIPRNIIIMPYWEDNMYALNNFCNRFKDYIAY